MPAQVTNYKCPTCTGPLHFVGASGKLECDYCGSSYSVEEIEALYQEKDKQAAQAAAKAEQKAATQSDEGEWTQPEGADWAEPGMKSYTCPSCGAELICDETTAATSCPYCGNTTIVPGQLSGIKSRCDRHCLCNRSRLIRVGNTVISPDSVQRIIHGFIIHLCNLFF